MLKNYLTIAWRNIQQNKSVTFINVFGLALGMAAYWLILHYVADELSYDEFHLNKASLYRVHYQQYKAGTLEVDNAAAVPAVGPAMKDNFPQVVDYARLVTLNPTIVAYQNRRYREEKIRVVDPSFLKLFTFPLSKGDLATALTAPHTAVITETTARKYFGNDDPIGKVITVDGKLKVEIRGVCREVPVHSHIKFDFLISLQQFFGEKQEKADWYWYDFYTYVQLSAGIDQSAFQIEFNQWVSRVRSEEWKREELRQEFTLQPITDLHLYSHRMQELEPKEQGDGRAVHFLLIIGAFILMIAWANYINLTTAHSVKRAKEIGVRKVIGAYGAQLQKQFLMESILLNITAAVIAVVLIFEAAPWLEKLTEHPLRTLQPFSGGVWFGTIIVGSLLSGFYPALVLSRLKPVAVLKGYARSMTGGIRLRQNLVVFQFVISMVLTVGTLIVYRQLTHLRAKDLGVKLEQTLIVSSPGISGLDSVYAHTLHAFKTELLKLSAVRQITVSSSVPGQEIGWMNTIAPISTNPSVTENVPSNKAIFIVGIDPDYVPSYSIKLLAGRNFSEAFRLDQDALLLNQAATRLLGYANPHEAIGQLVNFRGKDRFIIGILDDYN
ncbi:MAG: ABC transporter permease, partial [bacterium]